MDCIGCMARASLCRPNEVAFSQGPGHDADSQALIFLDTKARAIDVQEGWVNPSGIDVLAALAKCEGLQEGSATGVCHFRQ